MPPVRRAKRKADDYTPQERQVLLTGVPLSPVSTRFGHPFRGGWNVPEIRRAWSVLEGELIQQWQTQEFARYRARFSEPFAVRTLR